LNQHILKIIHYSNAVTYTLNDEGHKIAESLESIKETFEKLNEIIKEEKQENLFYEEFTDKNIRYDKNRKSFYKRN
jgi:Asp-tRNA(Asn)/Glu-tRNA(Gln) amidotransferase C subunit